MTSGANIVDTNIIFDVYWEKRIRHNDALNFLGSFPYRGISYTYHIYQESAVKILEYSSGLAEIVRNGIHKALGPERKWDDLSVSKREEILNNLLSSIKLNAKDLEPKWDFYTQILDASRSDMAYMSKEDIDYLLQGLNERVLHDFVVDLKARYSEISLFVEVSEEYEKNKKLLKGFLDNLMKKARRSNDRDIATDLLVLCIYGNDKKERYPEISFYSCDDEFVGDMLQATSIKNSHYNGLISYEKLSVLKPKKPYDCSKNRLQTA